MNRPKHFIPSTRCDGPPFAFEYEGIPSDAIREAFFVERILITNHEDGVVLVLLGNMHVMPVARLLRERGHAVETNDVLFQILDGECLLSPMLPVN